MKDFFSRSNIYSLIVIVTLIILLIIVFFSFRFLFLAQKEAIQPPGVEQVESYLTKFDMEKYNAVKEKLPGLPEEEEEEESGEEAE